MKTLLITILSLASLTASAHITVLTGKKIECRLTSEGEVVAQFVLDSPSNQSNEAIGVLMTRNIRYSINTRKGVISSGVQVERVTRPHTISVSAISNETLDFDLKGSPYFRIVTDQTYSGTELFRVETNLNVIEISLPTRSRANNDRTTPMIYPYCTQTNENL